MSYTADPARYDGVSYRRLGNTGLRLPAISLGMWQNFGDVDVYDNCRSIVLRAFDRGVTHFDLANNYGPPNGAAEEIFGRILSQDLRAHRDEIVVTTKAGWGMWDGPYGNGGSRKYMLASLDQSLKRLGVEYVDIFYSHRPVVDTPLEETMSAVADSIRSGKALYAGVSSYGPEMTVAAAEALAAHGVPLAANQPSYSMINRWIEEGLLDTVAAIGAGIVAFSPLAQGMLTDKYLQGSKPGQGRAARAGAPGNEFSAEWLHDENLENIRQLDTIAKGRGQSLAQLALAWALRDPRVASVIVGARTVDQLDNSLDAADNLDFDDATLAEIDKYAIEGEIDLWRTTAKIRPQDVITG
jgi:L-glyceraldehyde 3-phosphate reductase